MVTYTESPIHAVKATIMLTVGAATSLLTATHSVSFSGSGLTIADTRHTTDRISVQVQEGEGEGRGEGGGGGGEGEGEMGSSNVIGIHCNLH